MFLLLIPPVCWALGSQEALEDRPVVALGGGHEGLFSPKSLRVWGDAKAGWKVVAAL